MNVFDHDYDFRGNFPVLLFVSAQCIKVIDSYRDIFIDTRPGFTVIYFLNKAKSTHNIEAFNFKRKHVLIFNFGNS